MNKWQVTVNVATGCNHPPTGSNANPLLFSTAKYLNTLSVHYNIIILHVWIAWYCEACMNSIIKQWPKWNGTWVTLWHGNQIMFLVIVPVVGMFTVASGMFCKRIMMVFIKNCSVNWHTNIINTTQALFGWFWFSFSILLYIIISTLVLECFNISFVETF